MSNFTKGQGAKITVKFTEMLIDTESIEGNNENAFSVEGQEFLYINGPLIAGDYQIDTVEPHPSEPNSVLITMLPLKRFHNTEGELLVQYDAGEGNLEGIGGIVESFQESFMPTDLEPVPNPHLEENIASSVSDYILTLTEINFIDGFTDDEFIECAVTDYTVTFTHIDHIDP